VARALECNCSICCRNGAVWHATDSAHFRILSGQDELGLYQFGTRTAKHWFCATCGISTFSNPRLAPDKWVVNLRCVEGIDLESLEIRHFDGRNWDEAARAFPKARSAT
jgi:hypothetical protein